MAAPNLRARLDVWTRRVQCVIANHGHLYLLELNDPARPYQIFLRCAACGHETSGWDLRLVVPSTWFCVCGQRAHRTNEACPVTAPFAALAARVDLVLNELRGLRALGAQTMTTMKDLQDRIDTLVDRVTTETAVDAGVLTLVGGLVDEITALKADLAAAIEKNGDFSGAPLADLLLSLDHAAQVMSSNAQQLATAVAVNTPTVSATADAATPPAGTAAAVEDVAAKAETADASAPAADQGSQQ